MKQSKQVPHPTAEEVGQHGITKFRGIDVGLGKADPVSGVAAKLEVQYPNHLILVQSGLFLHGFDRTAQALAVLKQYQLKLVGDTNEPHLRVGFPVGNFKKRLWSVVEEFGMPYVVALGALATGHTVYVSESSGAASNVLASVTPEIVDQVIADLIQNGNLNQAAAKKLLADPDSKGFQLKQQAQVLDLHLLHDIIGMSRDLRATYGENLRLPMCRIMHGVHAYGTAPDKTAVLHQIDTDINLVKHYLGQAPKVSKLKKFAFEHRAGLAVELGRVAGGLIRAASKAVSP